MNGIRIILIDPTGAYAAYSIPQGENNFSRVDVRYPKAGTWKAYFALSTSSGFNGAVPYSVVQTDMTTHGVVVPNKLTLAPGRNSIADTVPGYESSGWAGVGAPEPRSGRARGRTGCRYR